MITASPAEEDDRGEDEDEGEGDGAEVVLLERDRLQLGEERQPQEERDGQTLCGPGGSSDAHHRPGHDRGRERERGRDQEPKPGRVAGL